MGINIPGIEGRIERPEARRVAQPLLDLRHQRKEVGHIALVEGLGQFGQHELAPVRNFGDDDPRPIPPVKLTDFRAARRDGIAGRRGFGAGLIVAALAAETTIGITLGLLGFVVAVFDVGFGVVLLDPSDHVFGVERDALNGQHAVGRQFSQDEAHAVGQQELEQGIGQLAEQAVEVSLRRQAGLGIETQRLIGCWHQRKTQQGYETRVLQEEAFEFFG